MERSIFRGLTLDNDASDQAQEMKFVGIKCPECGYDVRGVESLKCPECGSEFDPETDVPKDDFVRKDEPSYPVCLHCFEPVNELDYVCTNCGRAVGQLTPYLPWESIRFEAGILGQMWDQMWKPEISTPSRLLRFFLLIVCYPIVFALGAIGFVWKKFRPPKA